MKKDNRIYLVRMIDACERAIRMVAVLSRERFDQDEIVQLALTYVLQNIGESASRVDIETRARIPRVQWKAITSMRHRLVHDYVNIDLTVVWEAAKNDVPTLLAHLNHALELLGDPRRENDPQG